MAIAIYRLYHYIVARNLQLSCAFSISTAFLDSRDAAALFIRVLRCQAS